MDIGEIKAKLRKSYPSWTDGEITWCAEEIFELQSVLTADLRVALKGRARRWHRTRQARIRPRRPRAASQS